MGLKSIAQGLHAVRVTKEARFAAQHVHQLGDAKRWVVAKLRADGTYVAPFIDAQPGGVHSYQSRSLLALASKTRVYLSRSGALRAARRIYGDS